MKSQSLLNRAAVKRYALAYAHARRAGKFTRVSKDFIEHVEASVRGALFAFSEQYKPANPLPLEIGAKAFVTRRSGELAIGALDSLVKNIISDKVQRHPTCGCTLK